ncbi:hypothetical protein [Paenibacillus sp. YN15]|uniref:hypothetical protein n=1 Tax=Paenibacillus sp. YN15 TaxID=1742774 RepID=UPI000DCCB2F5|nr:hypothetical protein [Paenibacillus sp. YN15]RAU92818.1 hypothetical protein DQG13_26745 [Paenibacillus sp. YN15]
MTKLLLWAGLIVPWFSLFFMKRQDVKRFMPATLLAMLIMAMISEAAYTFNWWVIQEYIVPWGYITLTSLLFGPFLVGSLWIFRLSYHKWWLFFLTNLIIDSIFAFGLSPWFLDGWLYTMRRINNAGAFLLMFGTAIVIYLYQRWQDEVMVGASSENRGLEFTVGNPFRSREKGKS